MREGNDRRYSKLLRVIKSMKKDEGRMKKDKGRMKNMKEGKVGEDMRVDERKKIKKDKTVK